MKIIVLLSVIAFSTFNVTAQNANNAITTGVKPGLINAKRGQVKVSLSEEEMKLYNMINAYRKTKKLPPIPLSYSLTHVAQTHSMDLDKYRSTFSPNCNLHSWSGNGPWTSVCYTPDHKNVDKVYVKPAELTSYTGNGYEIAFFYSAMVRADIALESWKKSPGHNNTIINAGIWSSVKWNAIGIGIYNNYATVWFGQEPDVNTSR